LPFENAVVLPLAISTAAAGLYQKGFLELPYPTVTAHPQPTGKTILVWGGSSSVGGTAVQLAVASGLEVISTASKRNFDYVKALGAGHVLDYSEPTVVHDIVRLLNGKELIGAYDAISSPETIDATAEIVSRVGGGKIVTVLAPPAKGLPSNVTTIASKKDYPA
jgi:NADPH:quinone reductase-like Zn-dependent oxidoreductase